jgi:hypothetical protein
MICTPCKIAGKNNNENTDPLWLQLQHEKCLGRTSCCCQHRIGRHVSETKNSSTEKAE